MNILEKLGLVIMIYGIIIHEWKTLFSSVLSAMFIFFGAVLFVYGGIAYGWVKHRFPKFPW